MKTTSLSLNSKTFSAPLASLALILKRRIISSKYTTSYSANWIKKKKWRKRMELNTTMLLLLELTSRVQKTYLNFMTTGEASLPRNNFLMLICTTQLKLLTGELRD
jgi:hypothetical protein